jgi:hypothetical protein
MQSISRAPLLAGNGSWMNLALLSGDRMDLGDLEQECNGCPDDVPLLRTSSCLWLQKEILCASIATRLSISQVFPDKMRKNCTDSL